MVLCLKARESRSPPGLPIHSVGISTGAGWSSPVARQAHNLKVTGSNPVPATIFIRSVGAPASVGQWACPNVRHRPAIAPGSRDSGRFTSNLDAQGRVAGTSTIVSISERTSGLPRALASPAGIRPCYQPAMMNASHPALRAILRLVGEEATQQLAMEVIAQPRDRRDLLIKRLRRLYCDGIASSGQSPQIASRMGDLLEARLREQVATLRCAAAEPSAPPDLR